MTDIWIHSLGTALGSETVEAKDLVEEFGPVREDFLERTGFTRLYRVEDGETGLGLASRVLETPDSEWWRSRVDALIYVTSTGELVAPGNSHLLQSALGLNPAMLLLDINDACTGFVRSLRVAESFIASGAATTVLLVLSDTYSRLYEPSQLKVSPLFSDGASAVLISKDRIPDAPASSAPRRWRLLSTWFLSEGGRAEELCISREDDRRLGTLTMNGGGVFNFVLKHLSDCVSSLTAGAGVERGDVSRWYAHQGSRMVVSAVEKTVGTPAGSLFRSADYGNTVGSSLPFMLADDSSEADDSMVIGLLAFGVGLTMAGLLVQQSPAS